MSANDNERNQTYKMSAPSVLDEFFSHPSSFYDVTQEEFINRQSLAEFYQELHCIDARHNLGHKLMEYVAKGQEKQALATLKEYSKLLTDPKQKAYPSTLDPLRDYKNATLSMNTSLRLAIESNHVPNIYINHYCSRFSYLIEQATTFDEISMLYPQMVHRYSYLARHYSMSVYSPCIKDCLLYIEMNLASKLSAYVLANYVNKSANYLSSHFKKEVGMTITSYIRCKRIRQAALLLQKTKLSIQDIASQVGIPDANYFTKQFKTETGMTPMQYRFPNSKK